MDSSVVISMLIQGIYRSEKEKASENHMITEDAKSPIIHRIFFLRKLMFLQNRKETNQHHKIHPITSRSSKRIAISPMNFPKHTPKIVLKP